MSINDDYDGFFVMEMLLLIMIMRRRGDDDTWDGDYMAMVMVLTSTKKTTVMMTMNAEDVNKNSHLNQFFEMEGEEITPKESLLTC